MTFPALTGCAMSRVPLNSSRLRQFVASIGERSGLDASHWWALPLAEHSIRNEDFPLTGTEVGLMIGSEVADGGRTQLAFQFDRSLTNSVAATLSTRGLAEDRAADYLRSLSRWCLADGVPVELAVGTAGGDVRVYLGTLDGDFATELVQRARRTGTWYPSLGDDPAFLVRRLQLSAEVRGFATRFTGGDASFLLYFVPKEPLTDDLFEYVAEAVGAADANALRQFRRSRLPPGAIPAPLYGWGVAIGPAGDLAYLKLELSAPAIDLPSEERAAYGWLHDLARSCSLEPLPHVTSLSVHEGHSRLTVYTRFQNEIVRAEPSSTEHQMGRSVRPACSFAPHGELESAIDQGLNAVLGKQRQDGAWADFAFPFFGESDTWVTAYVGWRLSTLPDRWCSWDVKRALESAVRFLMRKWRGGWGFNDLMPIDADSTAHAILFLKAVGAMVPERAVCVLRDHRQADGGFATFRRQPGMPATWCVSHPDVTPTALLALDRLNGEHWRIGVSAEAPSSALLTGTTGRLPAFWWNLEWYTLAAWGRYWRHHNLATFPQSLVDEIASGTARTNLDQALLLELQVGLDLQEQASVTAAVLRRTQGDAGLWSAEPDLRMSPHLRGGVDPSDSCSTGVLYGTIAAASSLAGYHALTCR
jgi:hypothetical protein